MSNAQQEYYKLEHSYLNVSKHLYTERIINEVIKEIGLTKKEKVLEIGCGKGRFSIPLLKRGFDLTCLDISKELLNDFRKNANKDVKIIEGDLNKVCNEHKKEFDCVIGFYILHHFSNLCEAVKSIRTVLKNGNCRIAFVEPNPFNPMYYVQILIYQDMSWNYEKRMLDMTFKTLSSSFQQANFHNFNIRRFGFMPHFVMNTRLGFKLDKFLGEIDLFEKIRPYQLVTAKC